MPTSAAGVELVRQAERLGVDSVWVPEFWAADALTPLAYLAGQTSTIRLATAIVQLGARTPAMLAMSAMCLQALSGGRFVVGIGSSGPQVMEGWHGVAFDRPVQRTRETIEIVRMIASGERLAYDGSIHQLPLPGGAGKAIRSRADTAPVPVYIAALGPAGLECAGFLPEAAHAGFDIGGLVVLLDHREMQSLGLWNGLESRRDAPSQPAKSTRLARRTQD